MLRPTITDYISALENPSGVFRTLDVPRVERDVYGSPEFVAGNSAAVFRLSGADGHKRLLKCYIRPNPHLRTIYEYVELHRPALLPRVRLLREEIFIHTASEAGWVDVVEGEWTQGQTLAAAVGRAVRRGEEERLRQLAEAFDALARELAGQEWAHGDLKPENIVVTPSGRMRLIDCDAMWIPALVGREAAELGTPPYRHPERTADHFDKTIDDHPVGLISTTLRALVLHPELHARYTSFEELLEIEQFQLSL
jgi:serine/threonine protein kinase